MRVMERRWEPQGEKQEEFVVSVQRQLETPVRRTESSENRPFTVTLKYFEGDSTRFEESLLYAKNEAEARPKRRKYLSDMWGSETEIRYRRGSIHKP